MIVLALDTSGNACSVALWRDADIAGRMGRDLARGHTEALIPMTESVLSESGIRHEDLDAVAVSVGPGSFTGIRAGLAAAHGFGLALGIPTIGVTTFEMAALAAEAAAPPTVRSYMVVLETHRADVYVAALDRDLAPLSGPAAVMPEDLASFLPQGPCFVTGNATQRIASVLSRQDAIIDEIARDGEGAVIVARLAARRLAHGAPVAGSAPRPLYIHPPRATRPAYRGALRP